MTEREEAIRQATAFLTAAADKDAAVRDALRGRKPKPLDVEVLLKIAAIAKVPDRNLTFLFQCIHSLVALACGVARRHALLQASDMKSSTRQIAAAAHELKLALDKSSEGVRE